ncbi:lipopolysaccharide biosynthesis protein RfbH [Streptomyces sp. NRRL S-1824]|uniref:lipopolysaccharide biosynthesis protein RfbH n=1 Tax=Streptomyces sp. NRRL S-1824 TaxID=1463889 RepID=UPI0007C47D4E|nr:lipopolysaccharide biosynthesis protein RfbH [Streptomyces sp. NRRL S-1824]
MQVAPGSVVTWNVVGEAAPVVGVVLAAVGGDEWTVGVAHREPSKADDVEVDIAELVPGSPTLLSDEPTVVSADTSITLAGSALTVIGSVSGDSLADVLRARVKVTTRWFHAAYHVPRQPQNSGVVAYSGRVFDHEELEHAVDASLDFWLTTGRFADRLQRNLADYLTARRTLLVNSGSAANLLAISALTSPLLGDRALQPGDEVITTACGFPTTVNPIIQNDCVPVFVDTDPLSGNVVVEELEAALSERTSAVMLAHALGNPFNIDKVREFCQRHGLWLIEDACDALGSTYDGKLVGGFGDLSTLSFYPAHHMTTGEGGAVNIVSDPLLQRIVESIRDWGRDCWCKSGQDNLCGKRFAHEMGALPPGYDHKFVYSHIGYNLKPTDWQAAIGCAQFDKLAEFHRLRRRNWALLSEVFRPYEDLFELAEPEPRSDPSWFGYKVLLRPDTPFDRTTLVNYLETARIQTRMLFGGNLPRQPAYTSRRREDGSPLFREVGSLAGADRLMNSAFFIGVYPGLTESHIERVADVMKAFVAGSAHGRGISRTQDEVRLAARDLSPRREAVRGARARDFN